MVDLVEADRFLEQIAASRVVGDIEALVSLFHEDAIFRIVGFGEAVRGKPAIRAAVQALTEQFEFVEWRKIESVVSGCDIAVRHHLEVKHRSSGKTAATETAEFLVMKDGKCSSFLQFADTALVFELGRP